MRSLYGGEGHRPLSREVQQALLLDFLSAAFYTHLLVKAHDRRIVVCESLLCPQLFRDCLADVLFNHFQVRGYWGEGGLGLGRVTDYRLAYGRISRPDRVGTLAVTGKTTRVIILPFLPCPLPWLSLTVHLLAMLLALGSQVASVLLVPTQVFSLLPLGIETALVVDCGFSETTVVGVYRGLPVLKSLVVTPTGGQTLHRALEARMLEYGRVWAGSSLQALSSTMGSVPEAKLEDIKVRQSGYAGRWGRGVGLVGCPVTHYHATPSTT